MALTYNTILRQVALAVNALDGRSPATLEIVYSDVPLSTIDFISAVLPYTALADKVLNAEANLCLMAAMTPGHPWRGSLQTNTIGTIAYGDRLPNLVGVQQIIGSIGDVRDSSDGEPLIEKPLSEVQDRKDNPNSMFKIPVYWYAIRDRRIYHTRSSVVIDVFVYNRPSSLVLGNNIKLPDEAASAYVYGALMECLRDDEFVTQAQLHGEMFEKWAASVRTGFANAISISKEITQ